MRAVAYFKVAFCGPSALYLCFLLVQQVAVEAGHVTWSRLLLGVLTRFVYAGIFSALCFDGMRVLRTPKQS